ncbi:MAG TPA: Uma2 family endonuclease [Dehalococcoidia bacterium]|nr:Uma2 family endonuclease [Dehalococcoidia bacterium]
MTVQLARRMFTIDDYYRMAQAGILHEDDRVELIRGEIVQMAAIGSRHAAAVNRINQLLFEKVAGAAIVAVQNPIRLEAQESSPQPDFALLKPRPDFYADRHPGPDDVLLVIEVADSSEDVDRLVKAPLYAEADVREFWIVALNDGVVETYQDPAGGRYGTLRTFHRGDELSPKSLPQIKLGVDQILG